MGNGTCLPISSTGAFLLCSPASFFVLKNLIHVPGVPKIFYLLVNLLLTIKSFLNSILTLVLPRISSLEKLCCGDSLRMACMSSP